MTGAKAHCRHVSRATRPACCLLLGALFLPVLFPATEGWSQQSPDTGLFDAATSNWNISGSNTLRLEQYRVDGDTAASPFQFEGFQPYNDFEASISRQISPFQELRGDVAGVLNRSPYRSDDENLVLERANLTWERGDTTVPYRLELGDFFGYFSNRTLQRPLKGAQIDLQPTTGFAGERHAFQFMSGISDTNYRKIDVGRDAFTGGSWLIETDTAGRFAFNAVQNHREADVAAGRPALDQWVYSVAGEHSIHLLGQMLTLEGELARLDGDIDDGTASQTNRSGYGAFVSLEGHSAVPLTYSARFQSFDDDFRPNGAVITSNRRSLELRSGYDFGGGQRLDGRYERYTDNLQHGEAKDTAVYGMTATTPLPTSLFPNSSLRFDGFLQDVDTNSRSTDQRTASAALDLTVPVGRNWTGRLGTNFVVTNDNVTDRKSITRQINLSADRQVSLFGFTGSVTPGLLLRSQSGTLETHDFGPSLAFGLVKGPHELRANYSSAFLGRESGTDLDNHDLTATYGYTKGAHSIGAEIEFHQRTPDDPEQDTTSYKFSVFWRISFNKPARVPTPEKGAPPATEETGPAAFRLSSLAPGLPLGQARSLVSRSAISTGITQPGVDIYEVRLLPNIDRRQRLAITHSGGRVVKAALVIDLDNPGDTATVTRTFNRVQEELIRRYGPPSRTFNIGTFSPSFVDDVNNGRFIRNAEWRMSDGTLRFGIPRRLDRKIRLEVQFARSFAPSRETLWSIESVR